MNKLLFSVLCVIAMFSTPSLAGLADDLKDGQHVLLIRHADAPGFGDPPGYQLDQCSTQRNLGDAGRAQAVAIGTWLTQRGVLTAKVLSSAWCRCLDTARLMAKGTVLIEKSLGSFYDAMHLEKAQTAEMQKVIAAQLQQNPSTPLILVTHHVNIEAFTSKVVNVGDMVLVKVKPDGTHVSHQIYPGPALSR